MTRPRRVAGKPGSSPTRYRISRAAARSAGTIWFTGVPGDWLGVGPGAHGRLGQGEGRVATRQWRSPEKWLDTVERCGTGIEESAALDAPTRAAEILMMGLRLTEGVSAERFERMVGRTMEDTLCRDRIDDFIAGGFLVDSQSGIRTTPQGRNVLNTLVAELLP